MLEEIGGRKWQPGSSIDLIKVFKMDDTLPCLVKTINVAFLMPLGQSFDKYDYKCSQCDFASYLTS